MAKRRDFLKLAGFSAAQAGAVQNPAIERVRAGTSPLRIVRVEGFIVRTPKDDTPEDAHLFMPPVGAAYQGVGLRQRLDHSNPSRFGRYTQTLLVKITTDQGIIGWGECHAPAAPRVHRTVISDLFSPILVGQDARNIEAIWDKMYSSQRLRGYATGFFVESIAGVDVALWDILGKYAGLPVYRLLGGKYRDKIPLNTWVRGDSPGALKESTQKAMEREYTVVKMSLGIGTGNPDLRPVLAVSEVMQRKGQVIVDSLGAFKLHEAVSIGRELDQLPNIGWWEDPLMPEDDSGYAKLADTLDTAICQGQFVPNRFRMRDLCAIRAMDITNVDVCLSGGITESKRMTVIADAHGILWTPHVSSGTVPYFAASMHLAVATPNCLTMENADQALGPLGNVLLKEPLEYGPGYATVPERPGLGIEFNEKELAKVLIT